MCFRHLLFLLPLVALATRASGQSGVITGQVRDSNGNPVPNATFEIDPMSGSDLPIVSGGFTDASGGFTTTITPLGDYRITIFPMPAPLSSAVVDRIEDIVVGSTPNNLGTIVLEAGVFLSGRVVNTAGTPLVEVDLEFVVGPGGQPLDLSPSHTNGAGRFTVALPHGQSDVHFEPGAPPYYGGNSSAPLSVSFDMTEAIDVGDIVLPAGYGLSGRVLRAADGTAVADLDFEFFDRVSQRPAFVPKDKTDEFGNFVVILPASSYDLRFKPRESEGLAAKELADITVPPGQALGTIALDEGLRLSGTVRGADGSKHAGVEISLLDPSSGTRVYLGDPVLTKGSGRYEALVPGGTFDLAFSPPFSIAFGRATVQGVVVSDDTTLDGTLPALPFYSTAGVGTPGTGGITPAISATGGTPRIGNSGYTLHCAQGCGGANAIAVFSLGEVSGKLTAQHGVGGPGSPPRQLVALSGTPGTPGSGNGDMSLPIPMDAGLAGRMIHGRFIVLDPAAPGGRARTNELQATLQL